MGGVQSSGGGGGGSGQQNNPYSSYTIVGGVKRYSDGTYGNIEAINKASTSNVHTGGTLPNINTGNQSSLSGWGNSTGNSGYSGGVSYSSQETHIQQVNAALGGSVMGGAYHDSRKNRDMGDGINYQVKGIVANLNYYGFQGQKGIALSDCALEDKDLHSLVCGIQSYKLNLTLLDLSVNKLSSSSLEAIFYALRADGPYPTSIRSINLSNNLLDDNSANYIAQSLECGRFPSLKYLDVSGNNISATGTGYIINALNAISQDLKVVLGSLKGITKDIFKPSIKAMLYLTKSNGIETKDTLTTQETIEHCKKGSLNVGINLITGYIKCFTKLDKPIAVYEMDFQTLGVTLITNVFNPLKKPAQFICMAENTVFSVVDEEFANCLTGLDSGFND